MGNANAKCPENEVFRGGRISLILQVIAKRSTARDSRLVMAMFERSFLVVRARIRTVQLARSCNIMARYRNGSVSVDRAVQFVVSYYITARLK